MNIPYIVIGVVFIVFSFLFYNGIINIPYWYAFTGKKDNKKIIKMLCHNIGLIIGLCGFLFLINGIFSYLRDHIFSFSMIIWVILAIFDMLYISTSKNYKDQF